MAPVAPLFGSLLVKTILVTWIIAATETKGVAAGGGPRLSVTPPGRVVYSSSTGVALTCLAEGSPPPVVSWVTREGHPLTTQSPYLDLLANGSLILRPFPPESYRADVHAATVRCRASNPEGVVVSPPVVLQPVVWQDFVVRAEGGEAVVGGSALLRCLVPSRLATHVTASSWETPTHTIYPTLQPAGRYQMVGRGGDLLVTGVTRDDAFTAFNCRVRDQLGGGREVTSRVPAKIKVKEPGEMSRPVIQDKRRSVTIREGGTMLLPCLATGTPTPTVRWSLYPGGGALGSSVGVRGGLMGGLNSPGSNHAHNSSPGSAVLVVESNHAAHNTHTMTYTCTANNTLGIDQMMMEVVVERQLTAQVTPASHTADLAATATFVCTVSDPAASITWFYNGVGVSGSGRVMTSGPRLIISGVTHDDPGMYQCQAAREHQTAHASAQLRLGDSDPVLHYRFIEQTIQPGPAVSLKCSAVGNPTPSISWTLDGLPVQQSDRVMVGEVLGTQGTVVGHVNISHTRVKDGGRYECTASNRADSVTHHAHLNIYGLPMARPIATVTAVSEKELSLQCPVAGYPLHTYSWMKGDEPLGDGLGRRVTDDGTLIIEAVWRPDDAGVYTCTASTKQGRAATGSVQVAVLVPPRIEPFSFQEGLSEGMRATVVCGVSEGDSPLKLEWLKDGQSLSLGGPPNIQVKIIDQFSSVLKISSMTLQNSGRYTCQAQNAAAVVRSSATLNVYAPPSWIVEPVNTRVSRGGVLVVDCVARGRPDPTTTWKKKVDMGSDKFKSVDLVTPRVVQLSNGSLYIARAEPAHAGTYVCQASNSVRQISATITITVNSAPYFLEVERSVDVRAGERAMMECRVLGDSPLTVSWTFREAALLHSHRHREVVTPESEEQVLARLELTSVILSDAGDYICTAQNSYGRNSHTVTLNVHEPPSAPRGLRVVGEGSRSVKVSWAAAGAPPSSYLLQYRHDLEGWAEAREVTLQAGEVTKGVELGPLSPATDYIVRVIAVNHLGRSPPSETLTLTTDAEKPGAPPRDLRAEATGPTTVRVSWRPPSRDTTHGTILGFYLGYALVTRNTASLGAPQYNFTTVESSEGVRAGTEGEGTWWTTVSELQPHTGYHVVVQAFNSEGAGPLSAAVSVTTREDAPGGVPQDTKCAGLSWDSVQVTWTPPEARLHHGVIRGYRLEYERWDGWSDATRRTQTTAQTAVLTGLEAATNYSVRLRAFTGAGDGPWTSPVLCTTEEDEPGRPERVRGVVSDTGSFIVSWMPPARPGGRIVSYSINWRVVGTRVGGGRGREGSTTVVGTSNWQKVDNIQGNLVEVEVAAATRKGPGPAAVAHVTLSGTVPAAIYSWGSVIKAAQGEDVSMACGYVGQPKPRLTWQYQGRVLGSGSALEQPDGSLVVHDAQRRHSGNYTCTVANTHGSDHITYTLAVLVPPSAPLVLASSSSEQSVAVQWKIGDTGGAPITGYTLYYRKDHGAWTQVPANRHALTHTLTGLDCGSRYHVYVVAHNSVGSSPASSTAVVRTRGAAPQPPAAHQFLTPNSSSVTLFPRTWVARACPITHMVLEYRQEHHTHWVQVSSGGPKDSHLEVGGLSPSTTYALRVTAVASSGSTTHTYTFTTLTLAGEVPPRWASKAGPQWVSVRVLLPLLTSVVALASSLALVCYCVRRKSSPSGGEGPGPVQDGGRENSKVSRDNKQNLAQREQYYATIRKSVPRDQQSDTAPENSEDIYPYATFQLPEPATPDTSHIPMYPIYQSRTDKELENYGEAKRRGSRGRNQRHTRSHSRGHGGMGDSGDDYETLGSETETEHGGVSSRTESSNQLDDVPSIRDHTVYVRGPGNKDPRDAAAFYHRDHVIKDTRGGPVYLRDTVASAKDPRNTSVYTSESSRDINPSLQQRIHHNLLYHAESSTSPEPSPTTERKSFPRRTRARSRVRIAEEEEEESGGSSPPSTAIPSSKLQQRPGGAPLPFVQRLGRPNLRGRQDPPEVSEAECDREEDILPPPRRYSDAKFNNNNNNNNNNNKSSRMDYSIAV